MNKLQNDSQNKIKIKYSVKFGSEHKQIKELMKEKIPKNVKDINELIKLVAKDKSEIPAFCYVFDDDIKTVIETKFSIGKYNECIKETINTNKKNSHLFIQYLAAGGYNPKKYSNEINKIYNSLPVNVAKSLQQTEYVSKEKEKFIKGKFVQKNSQKKIEKILFIGNKLENIVTENITVLNYNEIFSQNKKLDEALVDYYFLNVESNVYDKFVKDIEKTNPNIFNFFPENIKCDLNEFGDIMNKKNTKHYMAGINVPTLYISNNFLSFFPLHREDQHLNSNSLMIKGGLKLWYFLNEKGSSIIEQYLEENFPLDRECCSNFIHHKNFIINPYLIVEILKKHNENLFFLVQEPGEILLINPKCYHFGFNFDNCVNRAVNYNDDLTKNLSKYTNSKTCNIENYVNMRKSIKSPSLNAYMFFGLRRLTMKTMLDCSEESNLSKAP